MDNLGFTKARHLVTRTGLGAEWDEIQQLKNLPLDQAIERIFKKRDLKLPPAPKMSPWPRMLALRGNMRRRKMVKRIANVEGKGLQNWWVKHLLKTKSPFLERMTLFWHNHFPSSIEKTNQPSMLYQQNLLLRKHALGNFRDMLFAISKDPAMLLYLDGYDNVKGNPNENFAREILELFTIGRGQYSNQDIREAARAFTGWSIDDRSGRFVFRGDLHDSGVKTFLGQTGRFKGDDILNIVLKNPHTAQRIADKMWHEFINISSPDKSITRQWAQQFLASNYDIPTLLKAILTSKPFWAQANRGALIKSPIELTIGTLRALPYTLPRNNLAHNLNIMGQGVFAHPSVKGWEGGDNWISTQSMLRRASMMTNLARGNLNAHRGQSGISQRLPDLSTDEMIDWLLPVKPIQPLPQKQGKQRLVRALVLDPSYQVA